MRTIEAEAFTVLYSYDEDGNMTWNTSQTFFAEEDAIADALSLAGPKHIRIVRHGLPKYILPDTLKTLNTTKGEIIDYGQETDSAEYPHQRDNAEPDAEDS